MQKIFQSSKATKNILEKFKKYHNINIVVKVNCYLYKIKCVILFKKLNML